MLQAVRTAHEDLHEQSHEPTSQRRPASGEVKGRRARILARALYKDLRAGGSDGGEIVAIATELLALVTENLRRT